MLANTPQQPKSSRVDIHLRIEGVTAVLFRASARRNCRSLTKEAQMIIETALFGRSGPTFDAKVVKAAHGKRHETATIRVS